VSTEAAHGATSASACLLF